MELRKGDRRFKQRYEIFTDRSSLKEMNGRWAKLATGLSIAIAIFLALETVFFVREPALPTCIRLITLAVLLIVFVRAILIMRNPDKKKNVRWDGLLLAIFFIVLIAGNAGALYLNAIRPDFDGEYMAENVDAIPAVAENAMLWDSIKIAYSDNYYMDLQIAADSPVCISLVSESGEAVYPVAESSFAKEDIKLQLKKGVYKIYLSDYAGGKLDVKLDVD